MCHFRFRHLHHLIWWPFGGYLPRHLELDTGGCACKVGNRVLKWKSAAIVLTLVGRRSLHGISPLHHCRPRFCPPEKPASLSLVAWNIAPSERQHTAEMQQKIRNICMSIRSIYLSKMHPCHACNKMLSIAPGFPHSKKSQKAFSLVTPLPSQIQSAKLPVTPTSTP